MIGGIESNGLDSLIAPLIAFIEPDYQKAINREVKKSSDSFQFGPIIDLANFKASYLKNLLTSLVDYNEDSTVSMKASVCTAIRRLILMLRTFESTTLDRFPTFPKTTELNGSKRAKVIVSNYLTPLDFCGTKSEEGAFLQTDKCHIILWVNSDLIPERENSFINNLFDVVLFGDNQARPETGIKIVKWTYDDIIDAFCYTESSRSVYYSRKGFEIFQEDPHKILVAINDASSISVLDLLCTELSDKIWKCFNEWLPNIFSERLDNLVSARLLPLTANDLKTIEDRINKIFLNVVKVRKSCDLLESDLQRLKDEVWLNDRVIDTYMELLQARNKVQLTKNLVQRPSYFWNSYFMTQLLNNANVKRSLKSDLTQADKIFFPVNITNTHWALAVIFMQEKEIRYYDSMFSSKDQEDIYLNALLQMLVDWHQMSDKQFQKDEWNLFNTDIEILPQQRNGVDCGVFCIMFADFLSDDLELNLFDQSHMELFRRKIAYFLVEGEIKYVL